MCKHLRLIYSIDGNENNKINPIQSIFIWSNSKWWFSIDVYQIRNIFVRRCVHSAHSMVIRVKSLAIVFFFSLLRVVVFVSGVQGLRIRYVLFRSAVYAKKNIHYARLGSSGILIISQMQAIRLHALRIPRHGNPSHTELISPEDLGFHWSGMVQWTPIKFQ